MTAADRLLLGIAALALIGLFMSMGWALRGAQNVPGPRVGQHEVPSSSAPKEDPAIPPLPSADTSDRPLVPTPEWEQADLQGLAGTWVDEKHGDALAAGALIPGGVRAEFVEGRKDSKTPWNVVVHAPGPGHVTSDTVILGCGFYRDLHHGRTVEEVAFRSAFCRGYGLRPGDAHATTIRLEERADGALRLRIGSLLDEVLVRP